VPGGVARGMPPEWAALGEASRHETATAGRCSRMPDRSLTAISKARPGPAGDDPAARARARVGGGDVRGQAGRCSDGERGPREPQPDLRSARRSASSTAPATPRSRFVDREREGVGVPSGVAVHLGEHSSGPATSQVVTPWQPERFPVARDFSG